MNKQELIDKAVHFLSGKWIDSRVEGCMFGINKETGNAVILLPSLFDGKSTPLGTKKEFQQRARELGYINGYRWGVEYETNGKKPDLPDDVVVCPSVHGYGASGAVSVWHWDADAGIDKFKITDQRYKPEDTSYLDEPTVKECLTDEWYDYDNQKALRLPPVGIECEVYGALGPYNQWQKCKVMAKHKSIVFVCDADNWTHRKDIDFEFRPLDWNRKAEQERKRVVDAAFDFYKKEPGLPYESFFSLYDAGFLRMSEGK